MGGCTHTHKGPDPFTLLNVTYTVETIGAHHPHPCRGQISLDTPQKDGTILKSKDKNIFFVCLKKVFWPFKSFSN